jgi:tetratricopeptide (TPR) repeat protein
MKKIYLLSFVFLYLGTIAWAQNSKKSRSSFTLKQADSLFFISAWKNAIPVYEDVLKKTPENGLAWNRLGYCYHNLGEYDKAMADYDKSLLCKPTPQLEATVQSRLARIYAVRKETEKAFASLEKAIQLGYINLSELQTQKELDPLRNDKRFEEVLKRVTNNAFPCMTNAHAREFDFWIGEWDVYPNGTLQLVGNSKVEIAAGGCFLLENWTALGPVPNTGKSMNYINTATGKWEQFWIGSGGLTINNPQKFVEGEYKDGAMRFTFEQFNPQGGKQIGRFIFFNEGPDQVRQFNEVSSDGGNTWTTVYDFVYKRKK